MPSSPRSSSRTNKGKPPARFTPYTKMETPPAKKQLQARQQQSVQQQQLQAKQQQQQQPVQQQHQQQPVQQQYQQQPVQQQQQQQPPQQQQVQPAQQEPIPPQQAQQLQNVQEHVQQAQLLTALVAQIQALKESVDQLRDDTSINQAETQRLRQTIDQQNWEHPPNSNAVINVPDLQFTPSVSQATTTTPMQPYKKLYDLPTFNGKADEWPLFYANFEETTNNFGYSPIENTIRLQKCLQGEAKEAVAALLIHPNNVMQVMDTLSFRFGRPDLLVKAQLTKIQQFAAISENRVESVISFATMVENVVAFLISAKCENHLANPMLLEELVVKLPPSQRLEWAKRASSIKPYASIKDFATWLSEQAKIIQMLPQLSGPVNIRGHTSQPRRILHTNENILTSKRENSRIKCVSCGGSHQLIDCSRFLSLSVKDKWEMIKSKHLCFSCLKGGHGTATCRIKKRCNIGGCVKFHHRKLHENSSSSSPTSSSSDKSSSSTSQHPKPSTTAQSSMRMHTCQTKATNGQLFRILPVILTGPRGNVQTFAMFDEGSSITVLEEATADKLGLKGQVQQLTLQWYGTKVVTEPSRKVAVDIQGIGKTDMCFPLRNVRTVKDLNLPSQSFNKVDFKHLKDIPIQNYKNARPVIMIGLDNCHLGVARQVIEDRNKSNRIIAAHTKLGWVAYGPQHAENSNWPVVMHMKEKDTLEHLNKLVEEYFSLESFGVQRPEITMDSDENQRARKILEDTTKKVGSQYESGLLWRNDEFHVPDSYQMALKRLSTLEVKMSKDADFSMKYKKQMANYIKAGYARELTPSDLKQNHGRVWYLPHFGVINPHKPDKLRIVFDAAAESQGVSLNSMLLKGPEQAKPLLTILFKFRQGAVGVVADIKEMFSQVKIRAEDQNVQRFLWRDKVEKPIRTFVMTSMIFGAVCSPCTAEYIKNLNAISYENTSPEAVNIIVNKHYVDDLVSSFDTPSEAELICQEVKKIHAEGGFTLRNFVSNAKDVQAKLNSVTENAPSTVKLESKETAEKVLGMYWNPDDDTFRFRLAFHRISDKILNLSTPPTKREMLGIIMSVFDPYGFLGNFLIYAKILLQKTWNIGIGWDDPLPNEIFCKWKLWWTALKDVSEFQLPRCYSPVLPHADNIQLHIFTDASESAFAAVGYLRFQYLGEVCVAFVSGKSKCAPKKTISIPRLELQAAVLGSRLQTTIQMNHDVPISKVVYWSDSQTTIWWIQSTQRRYKPFVAHRITEILESSKPSDWNWLPTELNVADDATRAKSLPKFSKINRWLTGPEFLLLPEQQWPHSKETHPPKTLQEEIRPRILHINKAEAIINISNYSSFLKLKRIVAWILRSHAVLNRARIRIATKQKGEIICPNHKVELTLEEIKAAENFLCIQTQNDAFYQERKSLEEGKKISKKSTIYKLSPYLDQDNLLRVQGRIDQAYYLPEEARRPIILPQKHAFTHLIMRKYHDSFHHQNDALIINEVRQRYWVPRVKSVLKYVKRSCQKCKLANAKPATPLMGQLPPDRLTPFIRPFTYAGLDYFGPVNVAIGRRREKRWVALFTCLTTRAIHLELAADLSTDAFILCLRNFVNRRGTPVRIRSDNGTNFIGAQREISKEAQLFDFQRIQDEMINKNIDWRFNCPLNPSEGGIWERMVQSVKKILAVTLLEEAPRVETLQSLLIEAENIINSRPLTELPVSSAEEEPLTPNHFLIGCPNSTQTPNLDDTPICTRKQYKIAQQLKDRFWKRWILEYLPYLTKRSKWHEKVEPLKVDDIVIICDGSQPRSKWQRGRVVKVYAARDGQVRSADVKTMCGILRRPASKLAVLEVSGESLRGFTEGGMSSSM